MSLGPLHQFFDRPRSLGEALLPRSLVGDLSLENCGEGLLLRLWQFCGDSIA